MNKNSFKKFEHRSIGKKLSQLSLNTNAAKIYRERNLPVNDLIGVQDTLGQPSGKFDYLVWYTRPEAAETPFSQIVPTGWGDEFFENITVSDYVIIYIICH